MPLALRIGTCSHIGRRQSNEDAVGVAVLPDLTACVVADGMGGQDLGERCSQVAVATILRELEKPARDQAGCSGVEAAIRRALARAHEEVLAVPEQGSGRRGAATVVLAVWPREADGVYLSHLGDCRAYLIRGRSAEQLTEDHTIPWALVRLGQITAEEARNYGGGPLWLYLGSEVAAEHTEVRTLAVGVGDRFLLSTDGLHNHLTSDELARWARGGSAQACADGLVRLALDRGSRDNVTAAVLEVIADPRCTAGSPAQ
jgi:protein phosphatase